MELVLPLALPATALAEELEKCRLLSPLTAQTVLSGWNLPQEAPELEAIILDCEASLIDVSDKAMAVFAKPMVQLRYPMHKDDMKAQVDKRSQRYAGKRSVGEIAHGIVTSTAMNVVGDVRIHAQGCASVESKGTVRHRFVTQLLKEARLYYVPRFFEDFGLEPYTPDF